MGAVDAGEVHAGVDEVGDKAGVDRRMTGERHHDPRAPVLRSPAEEDGGVLPEGGGRAGGCVEGAGRGGDVAAEGRVDHGEHRLEVPHHVGLHAAEGGQPERAEPALQLLEIPRAQLDVVDQVGGAGAMAGMHPADPIRGARLRIQCALPEVGHLLADLVQGGAEGAAAVLLGGRGKARVGHADTVATGRDRAVNAVSRGPAPRRAGRPRRRPSRERRRGSSGRSRRLRGRS